MEERKPPKKWHQTSVGMMLPKGLCSLGTSAPPYKMTVVLPLTFPWLLRSQTGSQTKYVAVPALVSTELLQTYLECWPFLTSQYESLWQTMGKWIRYFCFRDILEKPPLELFTGCLFMFGKGTLWTKAGRMLGRGRPDLFSLPVLPYCALPNNIFTCTFLLLTVGDLVSEPFSHLLYSETSYWAELWHSKSLYAYVLCHSLSSTDSLRRSGRTT